MKMNSSGDTHENGIDETGASCSRITDENYNANLSTPNENKGAIPKTTFGLILKKKCSKVNNNLGDSEGINGASVSNDLKCNGFPKDYFNDSFNSRKIETSSEVSSFKSSPENDIEVKLDTTLNASADSDLLFSPLNEESVFRDNQLKSDTDSSTDENDLLSVSDDGCIYTYKGDHDDGADLPSSFFSLELPPIEIEDPEQANRNNASSPEMDYLEMDFDPGPSGDADSDTTSNTDIDPALSIPLSSENIPIDRNKEKCSNNSYAVPSCSNRLAKTPVEISCSKLVQPQSNCIPAVVHRRVESEIKMPWSCPLSERTKCGDRLRRFRKHHHPRGDVITPTEVPLDYGSENCSENCNENSQSEEKVMIWTIGEAILKQSLQIGPSSCGATAVLNVLKALRLPIPPIEAIQEYVNTQYRAENAPLTQYLLSRSKAGCTHCDIMIGLHNASNGRVYSRFFAMYPERVVNLQKWLSYWMKNGAVPVATLNLQKAEDVIPDSWHHQMIFGVKDDLVYLTNPYECVEIEELWPQLCSESVLLIRREDVISRFDPRKDLNRLMEIDDIRWRRLNVVGQVANIIRESRRQEKVGFINTPFLKIPAEYKAGITLVIDINAPAFKLLHQCPELPLLNTEDVASSALYK